MGTSLMDSSDREFLWNLFENWLGENLDINKAVFKSKHVENAEQIRNLPWKGFTVVFFCVIFCLFL